MIGYYQVCFLVVALPLASVWMAIHCLLRARRIADEDDPARSLWLVAGGAMAGVALFLCAVLVFVIASS